MVAQSNGIAAYAPPSHAFGTPNAVRNAGNSGGNAYRSSLATSQIPPVTTTGS
jgi:hypothetical protein